MLKAGVASAVLPPAVTYVRSRWARDDGQRLFVRSFFFNEPLCGSLTRARIHYPTVPELETIFTGEPEFSTADAIRIAAFEAACVAPVGPSFYDFVMQQRTVPEKIADYAKKVMGLWD